MSKAALSIFVYGLYALGAGLTFLFASNVALPMYGMEPAADHWILTVSILTLGLSYYYITGCTGGESRLLPHELERPDLVLHRNPRHCSSRQGSGRHDCRGCDRSGYGRLDILGAAPRRTASVTRDTRPRGRVFLVLIKTCRTSANQYGAICNVLGALRN